MKLLLCVASLKDIEQLLPYYSASPQADSALRFLTHVKILRHDVDLLESGAGVFQTTYKVAKVLSQDKYHLALKAGFGNSYKAEISVGSVLNVINDKPGDFGMFASNEWEDIYDLGLLNRDDEPHVRGGFINLNTA